MVEYPQSVLYFGFSNTTWFPSEHQLDTRDKLLSENLLVVNRNLNGTELCFTLDYILVIFEGITIIFPMISL